MERMTVYVSPSGHLHLHKRCTAGGPASRMRQQRITRAEYDEAWATIAANGAMLMCRCLRHTAWGQENAKARLRAALDDRRATYRGRSQA